MTATNCSISGVNELESSANELALPLPHFKSDALPLHIATLVCVRTGKAMPFTREQLSAINKAPIQAPMAVNFMGLLEDEQADRRHHGGHLKAVHQMSPDTYHKINDFFKLKLEVGSLGENLTTKPILGQPDMTEATVCIGDVYQYGQYGQYSQDGQFDDNKDKVQLRVVQPRRPCYKINDQIGQLASNENIAAWVSRNGVAGWYFEVIKDGLMAIDAPVYLVSRPYPFATLQALWELSNQKNKVQASVIEPWLAIDCLEQSWKQRLTKKIAL